MSDVSDTKQSGAAGGGGTAAKKKPTDPGTNRTGVLASPIDVAKMLQGAEIGAPAVSTDGVRLQAERIEWSREADPVGSMPPPATLKGMAKTVVEVVKGNKPMIFVDKLGERLAFERSGTRLYEALIVKWEAASDRHLVAREDLERIRNEELAHAGVLKKAIEKVGADPTAMTPCADVAAVASMGIVAVLTDPRTTLTQCLEAILIAELADNDAWVMLADLAQRMGHEEMAGDFRRCLAQEEEHLARVRAWLTAAVTAQAGVSENTGTEARH